MAPRLAAVALRLAAGCLALAATLGATSAAAEEGRHLPNNHFSVDLFQGPILAPISIMGIAGAYSPIAESISGLVSNAATPAVREPHSFSNFEPDGSASISIPLPLFQNDDFDDSGSRDQNFTNFVYLTAGLIFQYKIFGVGVNAELQRYTLSAADGASGTNVYVGKAHVLGAVRLLGDQLMIGAGARVLVLDFNVPGSDLSEAGVGPEVGFLVRPDWQPFRVGATFRAPVSGSSFLGAATSTDADGVRRAGPLILPDHVVEPWELQFGVAVQVGPRPLNPKWIDPEEHEKSWRAKMAAKTKERLRRERQELRDIADMAEREARQKTQALESAKARVTEAAELKKGLDDLDRERRARYANWPREHLLLIADVVLTGPVDAGVSIQRFLGQNEATTANYDPSLLLGPSFRPASYIGTSGQRVSFSPRLGVETEPLPDLVHTRVGTYYEPARYTDRDIGRQHITFGADLKLFTTSWFGLVRPVVYKLQTSGDFAARYQSLSVGLGVWH